MAQAGLELTSRALPTALVLFSAPSDLHQILGTLTVNRLVLAGFLKVLSRYSPAPGPGRVWRMKPRVRPTRGRASKSPVAFFSFFSPNYST